MTFKIQRSSDRRCAVFTLSGRMEAQHVPELQKIAELETRRIVLDLSEVSLVDRDSVEFLARFEADGIRLKNCPAYIREWIAKERAERQSSRSKKGD